MQLVEELDIKEVLWRLTLRLNAQGPDWTNTNPSCLKLLRADPELWLLADPGGWTDEHHTEQSQMRTHTRTVFVRHSECSLAMPWGQLAVCKLYKQWVDGSRTHWGAHDVTSLPGTAWLNAAGEGRPNWRKCALRFGEITAESMSPCDCWSPVFHALVFSQAQNRHSPGCHQTDALESGHVISSILGLTNLGFQFW